MQECSLYESWGRFPKVYHLGEYVPRNFDEADIFIQMVDVSVLPRGKGRSYGDSCLNQNGYLISTRLLDKFIDFNPVSGVVKCDAGVTLDEILKVFVPKGWFPSVTPGTKYVTIGGAIANDVHGKNHHIAGTFCKHVRCFELLRSDGERYLCSRDTNSQLFHATIGGLGLTGIILWAEITLRPIMNSLIEAESIQFNGIDEFFQISLESSGYEYTVSWLDCQYGGKYPVRGIFMRGNHPLSVDGASCGIVHAYQAWKSVPCDAPSCFLSRHTVKLFNTAYYHKQIFRHQKRIVHYDTFFYPLDGITNWNRMYGKNGFLQWQCAVPVTADNMAIKTIIHKIIESKLGSFLAVMKEFGSQPQEGMLSFPMPGITLALDFPNAGQKLFSLLEYLDSVVIKAGGRIYPAKDSRMSEETFQASYPDFNSFKAFIDPKFSSSFYRRVHRLR
ncbi:MAG: FAD-binding oxidoreductase [Nitrospirae bacterium]|nr:FAD-binding oxidoreductase [Nitrospirota bacterium]